MSIFKLVQEFQHGKEMRESKDEIIFGEFIRLMVRKYGPLVDMQASPSETSDYKQARFKMSKHKILSTLTIKVNRWSGGGMVTDKLIGSRASVTLVAEVKNYVSDPDDVVSMYKNDFANIGKIPLLGQTKVNHQLNSVLATRTRQVKIGDFVKNLHGERKELEVFLDNEIEELTEQLKSFKK